MIINWLFFCYIFGDFFVSFRVRVRGIRSTEPVQLQNATFTVKIPSYGIAMKYIKEIWLATGKYFDHPLWAQYSALPLKVSNYTGSTHKYNKQMCQ